jgi:hypothetical protein
VVVVVSGAGIGGGNDTVLIRPCKTCAHRLAKEALAASGFTTARGGQRRAECGSEGLNLVSADAHLPAQRDQRRGDGAVWHRTRDRG